jgi:hypothetical protein
MALPGAGSEAWVAPVSLLRAALPDALPADEAPPAAARMPLDEVYERALRVALQVIAAP